MPEKPEEKMTFEQAMIRLEQIVTEVEQGDIPLEKTIEKYEQGMKLIQHCRTVLEQAEKHIETINTESNANAGTDDSPAT